MADIEPGEQYGPRVVTPLPVPREVLRNLTYEELPYDSHPIDIAHGSQGWGPFRGPYTPLNFDSVFDPIDIGYEHGDNRIRIGPGYQDLTVFMDPSQDRVSNASFLATIQQAAAQEGGGYSNTIANGYQAGDAVPSSRLDKLRKIIGKAGI